MNDDDVGHTNILSMGHANHGKSSALGALIYGVDTQSRSDAKREWDRLFANWRASSWWVPDRSFSYILDRTREEREEASSGGRTGQSVSRSYQDLVSHGRHFTIVDSPGHVDLFRNFMLGLAQADIGLMIVAANGATAAWRSYDDLRAQRVQNWRHAGGAWIHATLGTIFGLKRLVVLVTKMDLVDYSNAVFDAVRDVTLAHLDQLGYETQGLPFIPTTVSPARLESINLVPGPRREMSWYRGPFLQELLGDLPAVIRDRESSPVLAVSDVRQMFGSTFVCGEVLTGAIHVDEEVVLGPTIKGEHLKGRVRRIYSLGDPAFVGLGEREPLSEATSGDLVAIDAGWTEIDEEVEPGAIVGARSLASIPLQTNLRAEIFIIKSIAPIRVGVSQLDFQIGTHRGSAILSEVVELRESLSDRSHDLGTLQNGDRALVEMQALAPMPVGAWTNARRFQNVVLLQGGFVVGGGKVVGSQTER